MDETNRSIAAGAPQTPRAPAPATAHKRRQTLEAVDRWCRARRYETISPSATALGLYVEAHVGVLSYLTLRTRVEHMRAAYRAAGIPWPEDDAPIRSALAKAREHGARLAAEPLREHDLAELGLRLTSSADVDAPHDWALLALGADGGLDATELGALRPEDLTFESDAVVVRLTEHRPWLGDVRVARRDDPRRCPVDALGSWLALRGDAETLFYHASGARQPGVPLSAHHVTAVVQKRMSEIGRRRDAYSWRSLRATRLLAQLRTGR